MNIGILNQENSKGYKIKKIKLNSINYLDSFNLKLLYILDGSIKYNIKEQNYEIKELETLIINRGEHEIIYGKNATAILLEITDDFISNYKSIYNASRYLNYIPANMMDRNIVSNLNKLYNGKYNSDPNNDRYIKKILNYIFDFYRDMNLTGGNNEKKLETVKSIEKYTKIDRIKDISLLMLSNNLYTTEQNISYIFKEVRGINFSEYIQQLKLYYASLYLANTTKNIEDIAESLGFNSSKSINRIFKKYLNMTPSEYREMNIGKTSRIKEIRPYKNRQNENKIKHKYNEEKSYILDTKKKAKKITPGVKENIGTICNIASLGEDYIETIRNEQFVYIKNLILKVKKMDNTKYKILGVNELVSFNKLQDIIYLSHIRGINITICFYIDDYSIVNDKEVILKEILDFYNLIIGIVGKTVMSKMNITIYMGDILKEKDSKENIEVYKNYLEEHIKLISDILNTDNFSWGIDLGKVTYNCLEKGRDDYNQIFSVLKDYCPEYIFIDFENNFTISVDEVDDSKELLECALSNLEKIYELIESLDDCNMEKIFISGLFDYIDVSAMSPRIKEIFTLGFMLDSILYIDNISKGFQYNIEYKFKDDSNILGFYSPKLINEYGIKLPAYWLNYISNDIAGHAIYKEDGFIVLKDGKNLYILFYGDMLGDYKSCKNKNISDLKKFEKEVEFTILDLEGRYKITNFEISLEYGNILYNLDSYDSYRLLNYKERELISRSSAPKVTSEIKDLTSPYTEIIERKPFHIIIRRYMHI